MTFKPAINEISKKIGKRTKMQQMANNADAILHKKQLKEENEQKKLQECSFRPNIKKKKKFENVQSRYSQKRLKNQVRLEEKEKESKRRQLRRKAEYEELKACTFKPKLVAKKKKQKEITEIRGLEKFLQLKDAQRKKVQDRKAREEKVFNIGSQYDHDRKLNHTKPKPFRLSKSNATMSKQALAREFDEEFRETHTFQPKTLEQ